MSVKKKFIISSFQDYSKLIAPDAGPNYSRNMNWNYAKIDEISQFNDWINIIDNRITEKESFWLESLIEKNKDTIFLLTIIDPCEEWCKNHFYYRFLFRIKDYKNVYFLTKYIPSEIVKQLDDATENKKMVFIPYPFRGDIYNSQTDFFAKRKQIVFSGNLDKNVYPFRSKFMQSVKYNPLLWNKVSFLKHPGFSDIGHQTVHNIIGNKYIDFLSEFLFMFISPSRCELELLKYSECAYAHCVPIGKAPNSFTDKMKSAFLQLDFDNIYKSIRKIWSIPADELLDISEKYYQAMSEERNVDILNDKLDNFLNKII